MKEVLPKPNPIDTDKVSKHLREKAIRIPEREILITNFSGSEQEKDLTEPANCEGYGRIRHFKLDAGSDWNRNPLPILPAAKALGVSPENEIRAQVFQNSVCNWRCWYCFVDYKLLSGDSKYSSFLTCEKLLGLFLDQENPPSMIDLTGGQPDLTPEWVPWMMEAIKSRGLENKIFLWSDDNLSNDYLWRYLTDDQIELIRTYKMYSRVCCFKGVDRNSFSMNTKASPELFDRQFDLCQRLVELGIDLYCYITLTASMDTNFETVIPRLFDSFQRIDRNLPLRIVPLKITEFTPVKSRMNDAFKGMLDGQLIAMKYWNKELEERFSRTEIETSITEVKLREVR